MNWLQCQFSDSFESQSWLDSSLTLPALGADPKAVTVSGFAGGGIFAGQQNVIFSDLISGVGIIAGGPYGCQGKINLVSGDGVKSIERALIESEKKNIAPLSNLQDQPVYIFSGKEDKVIQPKFQEATKAFYEYHKANVQFVSKEYGHVFPNNLPTCIKEDSISQGPRTCGYDAVGAMFEHLIPNLKEAKESQAEVKAGDDDWQSKGILRKFSQSEMLETFVWNVDGLDNYGYVFIPTQCLVAGKSCKLHIAFHACVQQYNSPFEGEHFIYEQGYNNYAVTNDLIILYPQVKFSLFNPSSCFDFVGYTSGGADYYDTKKGVQSIAVKNMIERITAPKDPKKYTLYSGNMLDGNWIERTWRGLVHFSESWPDQMGLIGYFIFMIFFGWLFV